MVSLEGVLHFKMDYEITKVSSFAIIQIAMTRHMLATNFQISYFLEVLLNNASKLNVLKTRNDSEKDRVCVIIRYYRYLIDLKWRLSDLSTSRIFT